MYLIKAKTFVVLKENTELSREREGVHCLLN